jgi:hypothetical protein
MVEAIGLWHFNQLAGYLSAGGSDQGPFTSSIVKTTDGGNTWNDISISPNFYPYSCFFFDSLTGIAVGRAGKISNTNDGGISWTNPYSIGAYSLYDIWFITDSIGYIVGGSNTYDNLPVPYKGFIYRTTNRGNTWQIMDSTYNGLNKLSFPSDSIGYAVGMNGNILKITNANVVNVIDVNTKLIEPFLSNYPSPTHSNSPLTFTYPSTSAKKEIIIYSIHGKEIARYALPPWSTSQTVRLPQMATGVYVARMVGESESAMVKFVVEK